MEAVADLFDRQGVIDYKEFITSLRPDKISNEVIYYIMYTVAVHTHNNDDLVKRD